MHSARMDAVPAGNVSVLHDGTTTFHVIGTAHVSEHSVTEVREVIQRIRPEVVCVELCKGRYDALTQDTAFRDLDVFKVVREGKTLYLLAHLALASYQRRMGAALGVKPGAELLAAVEAAHDVGARVELVDRDIHITLKRTWANLGLWKKSTLLASLMVGGDDDGKGRPVDAQQIEQLKEQKALSEMLAELSAALPQIKEPLIDERDQFLMSMGTDLATAQSAQTAPTAPTAPVTDAPATDVAVAVAEVAAATLANAKRSIVAVVGAAHVPGMLPLLGTPIDRAWAGRRPRRRSCGPMLKWLMPALLVAGLV